MTEDEVKQKLIDAGRILEGIGLADMTRGHISARTPGDPNRFLMKPHSFGLEETTKDNLTLCDLDGEKISGGPRHSEVYIHSEIYRARPDVTCVLHVHPDHAIALSASGLELRPVNQPACAFFEALPVYSDTIDLIRSREQGAGVARALGPHCAVLMKCHGVAVAGSSIEETVVMTIMLENACRMQILTYSTGRAAPEFPREEALKLGAKITTFEQHRVNFDYLRRKYAGRGNA